MPLKIRGLQMNLRGVNFGTCFNASGSCGFFGEGYPFHAAWKLAGLSFEGTTFVAKTTTIKPRLDPSKGEGNMPLKENGITPKELIPKCIKVNPIKGITLNAVGLSGPGARSLLERNRWQSRIDPFVISFMSVEQTPEKRLEEFEEFVKILEPFKPHFRAPFALEVNFSCPNVKVHHESLLNETRAFFDTGKHLQTPVIAKINAVMPQEIACEIVNHPDCDALCCSNAIPWGQLPNEIDWEGLFGSMESPLKQYGGGGLSGIPLRPIVEKWIRGARKQGMKKEIIALGGVYCKEDVELMFRTGADAVSLGTIGILRPYNMRAAIDTANRWHSQTT
jgi:dihydroorotate dehydrogenase